MSKNTLWLKMNAYINALSQEDFDQSASCPRCGAPGLKPARYCGLRQLAEENGQSHFCADVMQRFAEINAEQIAIGKALEKEGYSEAPTWRGGVTGDVELTRRLTLPRRGFILPHDAKL